MGSIGDSMAATPLPVVGDSGPTYATKLVNFLSEVRTRLEADVPMSSILIGLLDMANNAIQNLMYLGLYERASQPSTPVGSLHRYQNDLWWVSTGGAFKITNGAQLNATSVNGFTGDYGSPNPAEAKFVDADKTYYFYDDFAGGAWARTRHWTVEIAGGATSANRVRIDWGGSTNYTMTLPAAVPSATSILQMSSAGAVTASNAIPNEFALTSDITPSTITNSLTAHDVNPTGLATASVIRQAISGTNTPAWSGLAGGSDGRIIVLYALGATAGDTLTLLNENTGSTAANRFSLASASSLVLPQNGCVILQYDSTSSRWRAIGKNF